MYLKTIQGIIDVAWKLGDKIKILYLAPILCEFKIEEDLCRILEDSPWNIKKALQVLKCWPPSSLLEELIFLPSNPDRLNEAKEFC